MYEESKIEFDWKGFLIKLAIIIVIIILIIKLLPLENKNITENLSAEFNSNMSTLREGSSEYFVDDRLPNVGESREVSLDDLINVGAVSNLTDAAGTSCDVENSYVSVSNKTHNHELEIHLICGKEVDTVYVYFPKSKVSPDEEGTQIEEDTTNSTTTKATNKTESNDAVIVTTQKVVTSKIIKTTKPASHVSIIFNSNGGTIVNTQSVKIGSSAIMPINPIKAGYVFVGWFDANNREYNFNLPVYNPIILKAKWSLVGRALPVVTTTKAKPTTTQKVTNKYVVTFNSGTSKSSKIVNSGDCVSKPSDPIRANAEFIGWYLGNNLFDFKSRITKNINLIACYNIK
ncbi:MAG: InlB B-repeat-containing protein [Bacilli bacterium]|nr:InlB B-repeat-containing protein [Bacilli bacterium]